MNTPRALWLLAASLLMNTSDSAAANPAKETAFAYVGGGCFWCVEAAYELLPGVKAVVSGYAGGHVVNPTYEQVCTGRTGHAEVVRIAYDPSVLTYGELIDYFWMVHDPTTRDRQGNDVGPQYRSIILTVDDAQKAAAGQSLAKAQGDFGGRIVTEIVPLTKFYEAEAKHQDYFRRNPNAGYCRVVIKPKIDKLKKSAPVQGRAKSAPDTR